MEYLAVDPVPTLFGEITPVGPIQGDAVAGVSKLLAFGLRIFMLITAMTVLVFLLWGAFDWITSGGDKEKLSKAQQKITNAVFGILLVIVVMAIFGYLAGDMLGILTKDADGNWVFQLPTFRE